MTPPKIYTKAWFKDLVAKTEKVKDKHPELTLHLLLNDLKDYIAHLDEVDSRRGKGTSEAKKKSSAANGKKGGWKKGVSRKKTAINNSQEPQKP